MAFGNGIIIRPILSDGLLSLLLSFVLRRPLSFSNNDNDDKIAITTINRIAITINNIAITTNVIAIATTNI